jgi:hypothetical protein
LAQEWATNPEDDAVTGYPGEYSALHWAAKAAAAASGGAFKVSADDTTPGYLESKLALVSNSGLVMATTSPAGNEVRTFGVDLDTNPGLVLGAGGIKAKVKASSGLNLDADGLWVDLGADPGLEFSADGLEVKVKAGGGITKDADGLSVSSSSGEWVYVTKATANNSSSIDFTGLETNYDYKVEMDRVVPAADSDVQVVLGYGATPTWREATFCYCGRLSNDGGAATDSYATGAARGVIFPGLDAAQTAHGAGGTLLVRDTGIQDLSFEYSMSGYDSAGTLFKGVIGHGRWAATSGNVCTAIRIILSTGNIAAGTFYLWRRARA